MMKLMGWVVWDELNQVFDSRQHTWADVPNDGILEMILYKEGGYREMLGGLDYYFKADHRDGDIYASTNDLPAIIESRYTNPIIKRGKWVPTETFTRIQQESKDFLWWPIDPFNRHLK